MISELEWGAARTAPPCIVEHYLYADVRLMAAPGGVGKTTLLLLEQIHIALGLPLYGLEIRRLGVGVFVTAEDKREMMVARLRHVAEGMNLTPEQMQQIRERVLIVDVVGLGLRLTAVVESVVVSDTSISPLIEMLRPLNPTSIVFDPAVSFGVGESRVNDAEQGLIEAARCINRELGCAVTYVHHTGQAAARDKIRDQYAGRGGSAFADGARMVNVLVPLDAKEWQKETGQKLSDGSVGMVLVRPKLTYAPSQSDIYLLRTEFSYATVEPVALTAVGKLKEEKEDLLTVIRESECSQDLTAHALELADTGIGQKRTRDLLKMLEGEGRVRRTVTGVGAGKQYYLAVTEEHSPQPEGSP